MGFIARRKEVPPVFAKYNGARGEFDVPAEAGTEGAIEYVISKGDNAGQKRYRVSHTALTGKLVAAKMREDNAFGKALDVDLAFQDADITQPTVIVTARLMGGDKGLVNKGVLGLLEALNNADLLQHLNLSVAHNAAGSTYKDASGAEVVREFAQSTIFVRHAGNDNSKEFIPFNAADRPLVEQIKKRDGTLIEDNSELLAYAKRVFETLHGKLEAQRIQLKEAMAKAPGPNAESNEFDDDSVVFGAKA